MRQQHSPDSRHKNQLNLAGIIYIHDISSARIFGTRLNDLNFVSGLQLNPRNVVLCTTKWSVSDNLEAEQRAKQLENEYWKEVIEKGSPVHKFEDSHESAWKAVNLIIQANREMEALQIQKELADTHRLCPNTEAGQQLRDSLDRMLCGLKQAPKSDSPLREELKAQVATLRKQMEEASIPGSQRILKFLDLGVDDMLDIFTSTNSPGTNKSLSNVFDNSTSPSFPLPAPVMRARIGETDVDHLILCAFCTFKFVGLLLTKIVRLFSETRNLKRIVSDQLEP